MADNLGVPGGAAGPAATREEGGVHHQKVLAEFDVAGTSTLVSSSAPMPVTLTNLERAEDAAHSSGHSGIPMLAVRSDTAAALAGTTGDYLPLTTDSTGRAWVNAENLTAPIGAVGETAPASDTASSGLNGRLQRIAQRLTSLIALLPTSLGQKTSANSFAVVVASDNVLQIATSPDRVSVINIPGGTIAASAVTYSAGDLIGSKIDLSSIFGGRDAGIIDSITIITRGMTTNGGMSLILFNADPSSTTFTDDVAFSIDSTDITKVIYTILIPSADFSATSTEKIVSISVDAIISTSTLYAAIVAQGNTTWPAISDGLSLSVAMSVI